MSDLPKNDLPNGWSAAVFPDVAFFQEGPGLRKFQYREKGIPFLNIRTFVNGRIDRSLCKFLDATEVKEKYRHFLVDAGDILIAISGSIGKWAVARDEDLPLVLNTSVMRFRPLHSEVHEKQYLLWFLRSPLFTDQAWGSSTGSAQKNVGPSHVQHFTILLPPLAEQQRIAAKIDSLSAKSKRARDQLNLIPRLVGKYKQTILATAFKGELTRQWRETRKCERPVFGEHRIDERVAALSPVPHTWCWAAMDDVAVITGALRKTLRAGCFRTRFRISELPMCTRTSCGSMM
jgi:restriction endonuclease S subunit